MIKNKKNITFAAWIFQIQYKDMDTLQLTIEKSHFFDFLKTLSVSEKLKIYSVLKKSLLCDRMENLLNTFDGDELSMDDIIETIESVRQERYEKDKQYV